MRFATLLLLTFVLVPSAQFAQIAATSQPTPEQRLRALFYLGDPDVMERDGEAVATKKNTSLETRAWYVSQQQYGKGLFNALTLVDGMKKEAPDDAWTLAARTYFASDIEQAISLCEKATAKDSRDDILFLCTKGMMSQQSATAAELLRKFLDRHRAKFEASAQGLAEEADVLRQLNRIAEHKEYSDEAAEIYERALKLEPGNVRALAGKVDDLLGRKKYKEAADVYEKFPVPIESHSLHQMYWHDILPNLIELGDEGQAKRMEADARSLIDRQEPTDQDVQYLVMDLRKCSAVRADAITDLIEKRYPDSKASEMAMVMRSLAKLGDHELEEASAEVRSEIADKLFEFLKRAGRTSESADESATEYLDELTHYMEISSERLFEAAKLAMPEHKLDLVRTLADRKAHLLELEELASEQIEAQVREAGAKSAVWHYDGRYAAMEVKQSWATLADWEDALGRIYLQQGRIKEAEPKLFTAEKLLDVESEYDPGTMLDQDLDTLLDLGRLNTAKGNYSQAEEYLGRAMSVEYYYPDEHPAIAGYKDFYLRQYGNDQGLDQYMSVAYEKDRTRRKNLILKERIAQAKPIPPFKLTTIEGKTISSEELKGKIAVINFWGTWCGPCVYEVPEMQKFYNKYKDNPNVVFLTIDSKEGTEQVKKFMAEKKYTFPVLKEGDDYVNQVSISGYPTTWFVDRDGNKVFEKTGSSRRVVEEFSWRVEAMMEMAAGKPEGVKVQ
jgi:thiol-disulfide isomerase/thioredoxin